MPGRYDTLRFFLKDSIRKQIDFRTTPQNRGVPPPPIQKVHPPRQPLIQLPGPDQFAALGKLSVFQAIAQRCSRREFSNAALRLDQLAFLLWATQGLREQVGPHCALRTVPSAGARHAFETYLGIARVKGVPAGLYRYLPREHALLPMQTNPAIAAELAQASFQQMFLAKAAVVFVWTAIPARMEWRYDQAAHKVIAIDAGHVCQNLYTACEAIQCGTCAIAAYDQEAVDALLGVDGDEEFTLYLAPVGRKPRPKP